MQKRNEKREKKRGTQRKIKYKKNDESWEITDWDGAAGVPSSEQVENASGGRARYYGSRYPCSMDVVSFDYPNSRDTAKRRYPGHLVHFPPVLFSIRM